MVKDVVTSLLDAILASRPKKGSLDLSIGLPVAY